MIGEEEMANDSRYRGKVGSELGVLSLNEGEMWEYPLAVYLLLQ